MAAAAIALKATPAFALLASGSTQPLLTSLTLTETAGNAIASDFIPPMFGHPFKKGDVVSGKYPQFKLANGTLVPFTMMNANYWSDGSLKHASFLIRVPASLSANGTLSINIYGGGAAPGSSSRALSDFNAADLRCKVTGLDNLSGDWVSPLNDGISNTVQSFAGGAPDAVSYTDGAAGRVWRVRSSFAQSGAAHGQLECYWYVAALQNASGGLYGIRYLGRVTQPWYNSTNTPTRIFRSFSAMSTLSGASQQRDLFATYLQPQTFSRATGNQFNATTTYLQSGMGVQVSTTGTLPGGLSAGTTYWVHLATAGKIELCTSASGSAGGTSIITISSAGTGTHTLTPLIYCTMFGTVWTAGDTAKWDYIQGGGTVSADVTVRCWFDRLYWRATRMVPPYDTAVSATSNVAQVAFPNWAGPVERNTNQTGERDDIGPLPSWYARHFLTQAAVDETAVRVVGLSGAQMAICLKDITTKSLPVANNSSYSGMPAANPSFRWSPSVPTATGFTIPTSGGALIEGFNAQDESHLPAFSYYAYLLTGEPQFLDNNAEFANNAIINLFVSAGTAAVDATQNTLGGIRTVTVSAVQRFGIILNAGILRAAAWGMRDVSAAAALQPGNPDNASYGTYFGDVHAANWATAVAFNAIQTAFWLANGIWGFQDGSKAEGACTQANWMHGYFIHANAFAAAITESADALSILTHVCKLPSFIRNNFGAWSVASFEYLYRTVDSSTGPVITANNQFGVWQAATTWTASGHFVCTPVNGYVLTAGDIYSFVTEEGSIPGGFSALTPYYVVNVGVAGANSFDLSASQGGAPIAPSSSGSNNPAFVAPAAPPASGFNAAAGPSGYGSNLAGGLQYAQAVGATVDTACIADMVTRLSGTNYASDPKWAMASSF